MPLISRKIVARNKMAVDAMAAKDYDATIEHIRAAIAFLCPEMKRCRRATTECEIIYNLDPMEVCPTDELVNSENSHAVYGRAFIIAKEHVSSYESMQGSLTILLFNLGLAYHLQAIALGNSRTQKKALKTYCLAFDIFRGNTRYANSLSHVLLAVLNNMAHIYLDNHNLTETTKCQELLENVLSSSDCDALSDEDYGFFRFATLVSSSRRSISVAPAA